MSLKCPQFLSDINDSFESIALHVLRERRVKRAQKNTKVQQTRGVNRTGRDYGNTVLGVQVRIYSKYDFISCNQMYISQTCKVEGKLGNVSQ